MNLFDYSNLCPKSPRTPYHGSVVPCGMCNAQITKGFIRVIPEVNKSFYMCKRCTQSSDDLEVWWWRIGAEPDGEHRFSTEKAKIHYEGRDAEVLAQLTDDEFKALKGHKESSNRDCTMLVTSNAGRAMRFLIHFPDQDKFGNYLLIRLISELADTPDDVVEVDIGGQKFKTPRQYVFYTTLLTRISQIACSMARIDFSRFVKNQVETFKKALNDPR